MNLINGVNAISTAAVPVVMISACSLMALAFYNRLAALVGRLRRLQRECLEDQEKLYLLRVSATPNDEMLTSRMERMIAMEQQQTSGVLRRAHLLRRTLLCLLLAICFFVLTSLALEASAFLRFAALFSLLPAILFLLAALLLLAGIGFAIAEIRRALDPIERESAFVAEMVAKFEFATSGAAGGGSPSSPSTQSPAGKTQ